MSHYDDRPDDLLQDTKDFLKSDYGQYLVSTLADTAKGHLASADNIDNPYPERHLAKHSAITDVLNLINSPLDDDTPSHG